MKSKVFHKFLKYDWGPLKSTPYAISLVMASNEKIAVITISII